VPTPLSGRLPVRRCHHFTEAMSAAIQHDVLGCEILLHIIICLCDVMAAKMLRVHFQSHLALQRTRCRLLHLEEASSPSQGGAKTSIFCYYLTISTQLSVRINEYGLPSN
jgi:hypothetical protein